MDKGRDKNRLIRTQAVPEEPVRVGNLSLYPISRELRIHPPRIPAAFVWRRPEAIVVRRPGEVEQVLRIRDETRWAQFAIVLAVLTLFWRVWRRVRWR